MRLVIQQWMSARFYRLAEGALSSRMVRMPSTTNWIRVRSRLKATGGNIRNHFRASFKSIHSGDWCASLGKQRLLAKYRLMNSIQQSYSNWRYQMTIIFDRLLIKQFLFEASCFLNDDQHLANALSSRIRLPAVYLNPNTAGHREEIER